MTVYNDGSGALSVASIACPNGFSASPQSFTVNAGGSANVTITFSPAAVQGYGGDISVSSDKTSGTSTRGCSGSGVAAVTRIIRLDGDLAFGNVTVGQSAQRTMTVYNDGSSALSVASIACPNGFSASPHSFTVNSGGSANVAITFGPNAVQGYGGDISVSSDKTSGINTRGCSGAGAVEELSPPVTPTGSGSGFANRPLSYCAGGASNSFDHAVQYQIDWGDGTGSGWLPVGTLCATHVWNSTSTYCVRAVARCASDTAVTSVWSSCRTVNITVIPNDALFVGQVVQTQMFAGGQFTVQVAVQNVGTSVWSRAGSFRLGSQGPQDSLTWGTNRVELSSTQLVYPGETNVFSFLVKAPSTTGLATFQWRMVQDGVAWFGATSPPVTVQVDPVPALRSAQFVRQTVPTFMVVGHKYDVSITMRNTGSEIWSAAQGQRLGAQNPTDNQTWGVNRIDLNGGDAVTYGQEGTFTARLLAPSAPGAYNFQWKMLKEFVAWFGDLSSNVAVSVSVTGRVPYAASPLRLPGVMEIENFDFGGEGLAYHDAETQNLGASYRLQEGVDVLAEAGTGNGYVVNFVKAGEWLTYAALFPTTGLYEVSIRVANPSPGASFHVEIDGSNVTGAITVPNTGGWQVWSNVVRQFNLATPGVKSVRLVLDANSSNAYVGDFDYLKWTSFAYDGDGDRVPDWVEAIAGSDPLDSNSYLRLKGNESGFPGSDDHGIVVRWQSASNRNYRLQRSTNLIEGFLFTVATNVPGTPPLNTVTDKTATGHGPYIYRIRLE